MHKIVARLRGSWAALGNAGAIANAHALLEARRVIDLELRRLEIRYSPAAGVERVA